MPKALKFVKRAYDTLTVAGGGWKNSGGLAGCPGLAGAYATCTKSAPVKVAEPLEGDKISLSQKRGCGRGRNRINVQRDYVLKWEIKVVFYDKPKEARNQYTNPTC